MRSGSYRLLGSDGGMAEWFKATVLKTVEPQGSVGSNPTPSAKSVPPGFVPMRGAGVAERKGAAYGTPPGSERCESG